MINSQLFSQSLYQGMIWSFVLAACLFTLILLIPLLNSEEEGGSIFIFKSKKDLLIFVVLIIAACLIAPFMQFLKHGSFN